MGGSLPIHFVLLVIGLYDYNFVETDILCATSDGLQKYQYNDGRYMVLAHATCISIFILKVAVPMFLRKPQEYFKHFITLIGILVYILAIMFIMHKQFLYSIPTA